MNDNAQSSMTQTVIEPHAEVQQNDVHKHVAALIEVYKAIPQGEFYNPKELNDAMNNPILATGNPDTLLTAIDACLNMALPGAPLYGRGIGILALTFPGGKIMPAVGIELFPGKQVLMPLSRETAEKFEALLKTAIDENFGRIIKP